MAKFISDLSVSQRFILIGNTIVVIGGMFASLGALLALAETGQLSGDVFSGSIPNNRNSRPLNANSYFT